MAAILPVMTPQDSDLADFLKVGLNCYERMPNPMPSPHRHNEIEFVYLKSGSASYLFGGSLVPLKPRSLTMFWSGVPHQVVKFSPSCILSGIELPLSWILQWKLPELLTKVLLNGRILVESDPKKSAADGAMLSRWNKDLISGKEDLKRAVLLESEARLWRFADTNAAALKSAGGGNAVRRSSMVLGEGGMSRVEKMAQYIAENYSRPIRVEDIAKVMDLHPDYAMKIFHKAFGTRLADYVIQHRVFHAQRLLTTTDAKVMDIALESGFGSLSRFNANFKDFCGISPKAYRQSMKPKS
jgi:AraC-like DNA-binding protein